MMRRFSFVALLAVAFALSGCSSGGNTVPPSPTTTALPAGGPYVYVTDGGFNIVQILQSASGTAAASASAVIGGSVTQLRSAGGIVRDSSGAIYVANESTSTITVYPPGLAGNVAPRQAIGGPTSGITVPIGVALDPQGRIVVANFQANTVSTFAANATGDVAPIASLNGTTTGLNQPTGVAVDSAGLIYVANNSGSIEVFAAGATGNVAPLRTITGAATGLNGPTAIALDGAGTIYVANGNGNSITEYPVTANGNVAPAVTIAGSNTQLAVPEGLVVGGGKLFVTNFSVPGVSGLITVFPAGASGNVAPAQTITGLIGPIGISL